MNRVDIVVDLIARALGITTDPEIARLTGYLDLYVEVVTVPAALHTYVPAILQQAGPLEAPQESGGVAPAAPQPGAEPEAPPVPAPPEKRFNEPDEVSEQRRSAFSGQGGKEKREVYQRLRAFRDKNGLGCFVRLEAAANKAVTASEITEMYNAAPYPMAKWRVLAAALDFVEGKKESGK